MERKKSMEEKKDLVQEITEVALQLQSFHADGVISASVYSKFPEVLLNPNPFHALFPENWANEWAPTGDGDGKEFRILSYNTGACIFKTVEYREVSNEQA